MKPYAFLSILLVLLLLAGCAADSENPTISQPIISTPQESGKPTSAPTTAPTSTPSTSAPTTPFEVAGDVLIDKNTYVIHRYDNHCYLTLKAGNVRIDPQSGGCVLHSGTLIFPSMNILYEWLISGDLSEGDLQAIQLGFPLNEELGFILPDPEKLFTLLLPSEHEITSVELWGEEYEFLIRAAENSPFLTMPATYSLIRKATYDEGIAFWNSYATGSIFDSSELTLESLTEDSETGAIFCDYRAPAGKFRKVLYTLKTDAGELHVAETYQLETNNADLSVSDKAPIELHVYGTFGENYIFFHTTGLAAAPTESWLTSFKPVSFTPHTK